MTDTPRSGFIRRTAARFAALLAFLFGRLAWTPPPWLQAILRGLASGWGWLTLHRRQVWRAVLGVAVLAVVGGGGYWWWSTRPRPAAPARLTVSVRAPDLTPLQDNARPGVLEVELSGSAAPLDKVGKEVATGITMKPAFAGKWRWTNDRLLTFTPAADWPVGQSFTIELERSLLPDHVRLERSELEVTTRAFAADLTDASFYQDPVDPKVKRVEIAVAFTHPVDPVELEKRITLRLKGQKGGFLGLGGEKLPFTVSYDKWKGRAFIHSGQVAIPADDSFMEVTIDSGVKAARGGPGTPAPLVTRVDIPGMFTYFHVDDVALTLVDNERYEPEQVLVLTFTTGVAEAELEKNLSVWVLPKDLPAVQDRKAVKNYRFWTPEGIGPEILAAGKELALTAIPTDREHATLHSFKYQAEVGRDLYVRVQKGVRAFGGYVLAKEHASVAQVPEYPKEVKLLAQGAVLALSGDKKVSVLARDVEALKFEIGRVIPGQVTHLVTQTGGAFANPYFENYRFSQENITEQFSDVLPLAELAPGKTQYAAVDLAPYLAAKDGGKRGLFFLSVSRYDQARKRTQSPSDQRLILVTDLGIVVKDNADGSHDLYVLSIAKGEPAVAVTVQVLGKNGLPVVTATTDAQGHVAFPRLADFEHEQTPAVYVAKKDDDFSFLPFDRSDRSLYLSRFDIGGVSNSLSAERLSAYLFSDRGLYRPGDPIHVALIVKPSDWKQRLAGVPLEAVVTDPRGVEVYKTKLALSASGFEEVSYRTEDTSPTGSYQVNVYIVKDDRRAGLLGSTSVRVEEFLPDRLKISAHFSTERAFGWVKPEGLKARVGLANLFGTPATDRRIAAKLELKPFEPYFREFKDYVFFDPLKAKRTFESRLDDGRTNDQGEAELDLDLGRFDRASFRLSLMAEGYEAEGGRGVNTTISVLVSPLEHIVGFKADGDLHYISRNSKRSVDLIALDPSLTKKAVAKLTAALVEERWVSVLTRQQNGTYKYDSVQKQIPLAAAEIAISEQGLRYQLPTDKPGDFVLVIRDASGTELNRVRYSVVGRANLSRELEKNAQLEIKLNRADYAAGDEIELEIKAPYTGAGLITIERDHVYAWKWFKTTTTTAVEKIQVPAELEANGYVNVAFVRGLDSPEIFMSPLSYGVAPFFVSRESRINSVEVDTVDVARPGEALKITYKAAKPGKAVVWAVDEGILQVAGYRTPDPLGHFFKKRALEVRTQQILDLILPEFSLLQALSAQGGDEEGAAAIGANLNPFKRRRDRPAVYWSGLVDIGPKARTLSYDVPDTFNGQLRVMAIAVSPDSVGVATRKALVRGHFVLSPNAPTFVAPGDEFVVSVGVANNVEGSGPTPKVTLTLAASDHLEVQDQTERTLEVGESRETSATFKLKAKDKLGAASLAFTATLNDKRSKLAAELSVRPPVPFMTTVTTDYLQDGKIDVPTPRQLHDEYRTLAAGVSALPLGLARGLVAYLEGFPHGCTEQLVSQAFPAIVLRNRVEFGYAPEKVEATLAGVLRILRARQNAEGAFGFWAANSFVSPLQTVYALHFLTEAKARAYPVPPELLARGLDYLATLAPAEPRSLEEARVSAYAIYVLTRNGKVTTNHLGRLAETVDKRFAKTWKQDLAAAYMAASYKLLKQERQAQKLIGALELGAPQAASYEHFYDGLVYDAQVLYLVAKHFPEELAALPADAVAGIAKRLRGSYNTLSSAYTILGFDAYAEAVGGATALRQLGAKVFEVLPEGKTRALALPDGAFPQLAFTQAATALRFVNEGELPVFYQVTQSGFDLTIPSQEIKERLEIYREIQDLSGAVLKELPQGEEAYVHVRVRAVGDHGLSHVAVLDLLPGGFEVVLEPQTTTHEARQSSMIDDDEPGGGEGAGEGENGEGDAEGGGEGRGEGGDGEEESAAPAEPARRAPPPIRSVEAAGYGAVLPIGSEQSSWHPEYADVREDRVVIYGHVGTDVAEFIYKIKATNQGTYTLPPAFGESMYDRSVMARSLGGKMVVTATK
ncbi:MAG: alpha-2-macroglobulin family protein [Deltaproteobacteria bacterium]|nr:alpha-2-macroglobulin family protein [Deltaproteobacteria bacterium]